MDNYELNLICKRRVKVVKMFKKEFCLLIFSIGCCLGQKIPIFYYHHQIPIKIVHGYELKPVYNNDKPAFNEKQPVYFNDNKPPTQQVPTNHRPVYHAMFERPVTVQMPNPAPSAMHLEQQKRAYLQMIKQQQQQQQQNQLQQRQRPNQGYNHMYTNNFHPSPPEHVGFKPIVKPSSATFNDHAVETDPQSYGYVRSYVDQLKQRQKNHFDTDPDPEIQYFKQREHEIGNPPQHTPTHLGGGGGGGGNQHLNHHHTAHLYKVTDDTVDDESEDTTPHQGFQGYEAQSAEESYGTENQEDAGSEEEEEGKFYNTTSYIRPLPVSSISRAKSPGF